MNCGPRPLSEARYLRKSRRTIADFFKISYIYHQDCLDIYQLPYCAVQGCKAHLIHLRSEVWAECPLAFLSLSLLHMNLYASVFFCLLCRCPPNVLVLSGWCIVSDVRVKGSSHFRTDVCLVPRAGILACLDHLGHGRVGLQTPQRVDCRARNRKTTGF